MKKETYANKLAALLGIQDKVEVTAPKPKGFKNDIGITEAEIQNFRAVQGIFYFLQAPELFTRKTCKHCGEEFMVSRKYVSHCSYDCIRNGLEAVGIKWRKGRDLEALAMDPQVYDGNEPIWIKNLPLLKAALERLTASELV